MADRMTIFEENNWNELAEKFIDKHMADWEQFVADEYSQQTADEPPERDI